MNKEPFPESNFNILEASESEYAPPTSIDVRPFYYCCYNTMPVDWLLACLCSRFILHSSTEGTLSQLLVNSI